MHLLVLHIRPRFINAVFEMFDFHLFPENPVFRLLSLFKDAEGSIVICIKQVATTTVSCNLIIEPRHEISNNVVCARSKASDQPAHTHTLIRAIASRLNIL